MWAHVGNNFVLDFHEDELESVQPTLRNHHARVRPVVPARGSVHPADQQRRRDVELLPAGFARRRSRVQGRLSLALRARPRRGTFRRQHDCGLRGTSCPAADTARRGCSAIRSPTTTSTPTPRTPGHDSVRAADAQPRRAVGSPVRGGAGVDGTRASVRTADPAFRHLRRRRSGRRVERHLAATRRQLGFHERRTDGGARVVCDVLRPTGAGRAVGDAQPGRPRGSRTFRGTTSTATAPSRPSEVDYTQTAVLLAAHWDPARPTFLGTREHGRSEHQERSDARIHRRHRSRADAATWRSARATSGASTIASCGTIGSTSRATTTWRGSSRRRRRRARCGRALRPGHATTSPRFRFPACGSGRTSRIATAPTTASS